MGEAKRIKERFEREQDRSDREDRFHKRAQRAEGEIARLQAELSAMERNAQHWKKLWDDSASAAMQMIDEAKVSAWNAAIEKAAYLFTHPDEEGIADRIRELKE